MERRSKLFLSTVMSVALSLACFLLILAISNDFRRSWDVTADQRHSFSEQTDDFLKGLSQPVKLYAFVDPAGDSSMIASLLDRYVALSPRFFSYEIVDLQKNPTLAETLQVRSYGQGVLERSEKDLPAGETPRRERVLSFDEAAVTNALTKLLRSGQKNIYFVAGHGEREVTSSEPRELSQLANSLRTEGYDAKPLELSKIEKIPEDAVLLVMAGPSGELLAKEQEMVERYLSQDGKLLFLTDIQTPDGYVQWLARYGFAIGDTVIIDENSAQANAEPVTPLGVAYAPDHPITKGFKNLTAFTLARPIVVGEAKISERVAQLTALVSTDESAYLVALKDLLSGAGVTITQGTQAKDSYVLAAAGEYAKGEEPAPSSRLVVMSSTDAFSNSSVGLGGNRDFVLNSINWLAESEDQITVRVKDPKLQPLSLTKRSQLWLYFIFSILIPVLLAMTGILLVYYRRKGKKL